MEGIWDNSVAHQKRAHPSVYNHTTKILSCLCREYAQGKIINLDQEKNKKIPKGSFWGKGYLVSTLRINEIAVKKYIENQRYYQVDIPKLPLE